MLEAAWNHRLFWPWKKDRSTAARWRGELGRQRAPGTVDCAARRSSAAAATPPPGRQERAPLSSSSRACRRERRLFRVAASVPEKSTGRMRGAPRRLVEDAMGHDLIVGATWATSQHRMMPSTTPKGWFGDHHKRPPGEMASAGRRFSPQVEPQRRDGVVPEQLRRASALRVVLVHPADARLSGGPFDEPHHALAGAPSSSDA